MHGILTGLLLASFWARPLPAPEGGDVLTITFLDVGQGDAIVLRAPGGKVALVDAGPDADVLSELRRLGIDTIDFALATHAHADHIGGMAAVLRSFKVRYFMDNGRPHTTATYREMLEALEASGAVYLEARDRDIHLGPVRLRVLPPPDDAGGQNDASVGLIVEYGAFRALLTGDSEVYELRYFAAAGLPTVTLLKAAHHGGRDAVTPGWLAATRPKVVVISCGSDNAYGHPHPWAVRYYEAVAAEVYRTDRDGDVKVLAAADGDYRVLTEAGSPPTAAAKPAEGSRRRQPVTLSVHADAPGDDHRNLNGEYVVVWNESDEELAIGGWRLCDAASHCYVFPSGARVPGGGSVRLYTGAGQDSDGSFFMNRRRAVWNNRGDVATLWDDFGELVTRHAY